jgi:hypothetical protein
MLVACRLAGLSALGAYYAGVRARTQFGLTRYVNASIGAEQQAFRATARLVLPTVPLQARLAALWRLSLSCLGSSAAARSLTGLGEAGGFTGTWFDPLKLIAGVIELRRSGA